MTVRVNCMWWYFVIAMAWKLVCADIENFSELYSAIEAGPNRRVGFLSLGNFQSVEKGLPSNVEPVIVSSQSQLSALVANGTFVAGLVTSFPPSGFNSFSSGILSPQAMFFNPSATSAKKAVDAAIVRVIASGKPFQIARDNEPFTVIEVNSCATDANLYPFPTIAEVQNETWFQNGAIEIAALYANWGNTGDYTVHPPTGFWPQYYDAISQELTAYYGDNFLGLNRSYFKSSTAALTSVRNGQSHSSDLYFLVDGSFMGKGRSLSFAFSCFTLASGSTYFTRRSPSGTGPVLTDAQYAEIVVGGVALIGAVVLIIVMIAKERRGEPLFMKLRDTDDEDEAVTELPGMQVSNYGSNETPISMAI